ncbi:MAG: RNA-binding protein [Elusimicrobia bacterium]|nr:RNA-binding protein [Elusimicrobiota bacterium]
MIKKLFVGGLPYEFTSEQLREMFAACGSVAAVQLIMDGDRPRSKGFGFVEMATEAEAQAAMAKLNGTKLGERELRISEARPMAPRPPRASEAKPAGPPERKPGGFRDRKPGGFGDRKPGGFKDRKPRGKPKKSFGGEKGGGANRQG